MSKEKLVEVKNLKTYFYTEEGIIKAVDGVDYEIYPGETLGIVGESGCGKSVTSLSIMGLVESPPGKIEAGEIIFEGKDLTKLSNKEMRKIRGNDISMIFQEPMTSLNPVYTIGDQIAEAIMLHKKVKRKEAIRQSIEMLKKVGIPLPEQRVKEYPHQLSGGMRQRVMIAMALSCDPQLLIADEPTTALDVTIQAQILELMNSLKEKYGMAIMMITHDLGVIAEVSDRVAVMYAGKVVEYTDVNTLFEDPKHPYTWGLMNSIPKLDKDVDRLEAIPGSVPSPLNFPDGCKFNTRCPLAEGKCYEVEPALEEVVKGHKVRCWRYKELEEIKQRGEKIYSNGGVVGDA
ncbi:ABC transporter ATP-binding protein [Halanaerobium hydrogeniformans]|uniref:Oligopeptide/dipeptide ABC transporter, ATPase subunit n=1 Tax=Halanaerobium hydrogeniformans TaxID=656519 RepID=E4RIU6_HALHG|nr:ABC transporter ATP-binding protein [Halanaerobium hydrogeniformans]ADQ15166.1 oligopeptide/dipeptide ABC transporter, ATPase subunit [Halanaerobium hydrogeniformans]